MFRNIFLGRDSFNSEETTERKFSLLEKYGVYAYAQGAIIYRSLNSVYIVDQKISCPRISVGLYFTELRYGTYKTFSVPFLVSQRGNLTKQYLFVLHSHIFLYKILLFFRQCVITNGLNWHHKVHLPSPKY